MRCIIVASGPSARGFIPPDGVTVISVNGSVEWLARADYWFTLDPSAVNIGRMIVQRKGVQYCAAVPDGHALPDGVTRYRRVAAICADEPQPAGSPEWWLWRWGAVCGLSTIPGCINTGNSAWGALGLAYHLGFRDVLLVGVDGTDDQRIEGGRCNNLSHLPLLFESALGQVRLHSVGKLGTIPQMRLDEWLMQSR